MVMIRPARVRDEEALSLIDHATWTSLSSPAPPPREPQAFFTDATRVQDVLVAEEGGAPVGYVKLIHPTPLASSRHVLEIRGLAVSPAAQRRGVGRALVKGAIAEARARGARRVTLRVLAPNTGARALYESCGFVVEGVLRGEFHLDGRDVDDVLMAYTIA